MSNAAKPLFVRDYITHAVIREATAADIQAATDSSHPDYIGYLDPASRHNGGYSDFIARNEHGSPVAHAMIRA